MYKKAIKKCMALFMAIAMIMSLFSTAAFADDSVDAGESDNYKFRLRISSEANGGTGSVTGTAYADYSADLIFAGESVNSSNAKVSVSMKDVASLGISGTRSYDRSFRFDGTNQNVSMDTVRSVFNNIGGTRIIGKAGGNEVTYTVSETDGGFRATADSTAAAAVWHAIVNSENISSTTKSDEDSYAVLKNGSYVHAGDKILEFENSEDLRIDNIGDVASVIQAVKASLALHDADPFDGVIIYLEPGTTLALGQTVATLNKEATITITGGDITSGTAAKVLSDLRDIDTSSTSEVMKDLLKVLTDAINMVGGYTITVEFDFDHEHDWGSAVWTWADDYSRATAKYTCSKCGEEVEFPVSSWYEGDGEGSCTIDQHVTYYVELMDQEYEGYSFNASDSKTVTIPATGHQWGEPNYSWADYYSVYASVECSKCGEMITEEVFTTSEKTIENGKVITVYTAEFSKEPFTTQVKTVGNDYKFMVDVSSETDTGTGSVRGIVLDDYSAELSFSGDAVNKDNVTVDVWMNNVASLGVDGMRHYSQTINTGLPSGNVSMDTVRGYFGNLHSASVDVQVIDGETYSGVVYGISNNGETINAYPYNTEDARTVWHAIVNDKNVIADTKSDEDSYMIIPAGSYLWMGAQKLVVDSELKLDNVSDLTKLEESIRQAVSLVDADYELASRIVVFLEEGAELALGNSVATLNREVRIEIELPNQMSTSLEDLKQVTGAGEIIKKGLQLMSEVLGLMDYGYTWVNITFGHDLRHDEGWDATCTDNGRTDSYYCHVCDRYYTDAEGKNEIAAEDLIIPATGHDYEISYIWANDHSMAYGRAVCKNDATHVVEETVYPVVTEVIPATSFAEGKTIYTAEFTKEPFEKVTYEETIPVVDYKFILSLTSDNNGEEGSVTGTVYPDYSADLIVSGENVNTSNVTIGIWMKDVASLGVEGTRSYAQTIQTGLESRPVSLAVITGMFANLENAKIVGVCGDNNTTYTFSPTEGGIKATPDSEAAARALWQVLTSHVETSVSGADDSYIFIPAGSYIQQKGKVLNIISDLKIDRISAISEVEAAIREAAELADAEEASDDIIVYLGAGTQLAVGSSVAELTDEAKITVALAGEMSMTLEDLQKVTGTSALIGNAVKLVGDVLGAMKDGTTTVTFEFGHELEEHEAVAATCTEDGNSAYSYCSICGKYFDADGNEIEEDSWIIEATGHAYELTGWNWAEDHSTAEAVFTCANDESHTETVEARVTSEIIEPTCEEDGATVYTATAEFEGEEYTSTAEVTIAATGHKWGEAEWTWAADHSTASAKFTCETDPEHTVEKEAQITTVQTPATCTEEGKNIFVAALSFDGTAHIDVQTETVDAIGHDWGEPEWIWSDDRSTVTAVFTCSHDDSHVTVIEAEVAGDITPATCEAEGKAVYTATAVFEEETYTDTVEDVLAALGHAWGEPEWSWVDDYSSATATFTCENDPSHVETVTDPVVVRTLDDENIIYTAEVEFEGTTYTGNSYIRRIPMDELEVIFGEQLFTYDGTAKDPEVTVKCGETILTEGVDYDVIYTKDVNPGIAEVTLTGLEYYTGTRTELYVILFKDVPWTHHYHRAIYWAAGKGIAAGYSGENAGIFGVKDNITRGQVIQFLWRAAGKPAPSSKEQTFTDVPTTHKFFKAIQWAYEQGIAAGYSDGRFGPGEFCTRGHIITFMWRFSGKPAPENNVQTFSDVKTSHPYYKAIQWAFENVITEGYSDGTFGVSRTCTRGECVTFIYRLLKDEVGDYDWSKLPK